MLCDARNKCQAVKAASGRSAAMNYELWTNNVK